MYSVILWVTLGLFAPTPPTTRAEEVVDVHHGERVSDPYRWLEDGKAEVVKQWTAAQNAYSRKALDGLDVDADLARDIERLMKAKISRWFGLQVAGGRTFVMKIEPPKQQPFLVVMDDYNAPKTARVLVDPTTFDAEGGVAIDWFRAAPDGKTLAVSLSKHGTESGDVHLFDVQTGKATGEVIQRVQGGTAGGDLDWTADSAGFFYTRYPAPSERPKADLNFYQQAYFHAVGTDPKTDRYEIGKDFPRIAEVQMDVDHRTGRVLCTVQKGDGGEFALYLRSPAGKWRQFARYGDKIVQATFGSTDDLYVMTRIGKPRGELRRVPISTLDVAKSPTVVDQGEDTIVNDFWGNGSVVVSGGRLYVQYQRGGPSAVRAFTLDGAPAASPKRPDVSANSGIIGVEGGVLFRSNSDIEPRAYWYFDEKTGTTTRTALGTPPAANFDDVEVVREFAVSKDGTKVPVNIIRKRGTPMDGNNPVLVWAYGGYGVSIQPYYMALRRPLLDRGMVFAVANVRGGGEYGESWHHQGNLTNKQNVFDDFAGVIEHLVARKYTRAEKLAIMGGSNGGLLMGATLVQRPRLARVVVSWVGIYDMLRVELSPNGKFNITEFGTVEDPAQYRALRAYSPYHNVIDGTKYPPTLFITGENDPRVDPMQSRKMTARLQAAQAGEGEILLRTSAKAGHGMGTALDVRIAQTVDAYGFIAHHLKLAAPSAKGSK